MLLERRDLSYVLACLDIGPALRDKLRNWPSATVPLGTQESLQIGNAASRRLQASGLNENYDPYGEARYLANLIDMAGTSGTSNS